MLSKALAGSAACMATSGSPSFTSLILSGLAGENNSRGVDGEAFPISISDRTGVLGVRGVAGSISMFEAGVAGGERMSWTSSNSESRGVTG